MSGGDLIDQYLAQLRAGLRTPPGRTAGILAEAEDHLRESAAAARAQGAGEDAAQRAAITAFGAAERVAAAHRPSAAAFAVAAGMKAVPLLAVYLLLSAAAGSLMLYWERSGLHNHPVSALGDPSAMPDLTALSNAVTGCVLAGGALLAVYLVLRPWFGRAGRTLVSLPPGLFALSAAAVLLGPGITGFPNAWGYWDGWTYQGAGDAGSQLLIGSDFAAVALGLCCALWGLSALPGGKEPAGGQRPPARAFAVAVAMKACQQAGTFLLLTALVDGTFLRLADGLGWRGLWSVRGLAEDLGCALAGLLLISALLLVRRHCHRAGVVPARLSRWPASVAAVGGSLLVAVLEYLFLVHVVRGYPWGWARAAGLPYAGQYALVLIGAGCAVRAVSHLVVPGRPVPREVPGAAPPEAADTVPAG